MPASGCFARWICIRVMSAMIGNQRSTRHGLLTRMPMRKTVTSVSLGAVNRPGTTWTMVSASLQ